MTNLKYIRENIVVLEYRCAEITNKFTRRKLATNDKKNL